ncbi:acidobacterial duplicated orphan permease [uncultured Eubacterium sp.]|nr:acidobacterial duplicated orphan permease [uncultured Eubacterium sp.]
MLLKNDNQKFIKTLSSSCLAANKNRNRIAVLAIILTTILFMAVATVFQGSEETIKQQALEMAGSRYMVTANYLSRNDAVKIKEHPDFLEAGMSRTVGTVQNRELTSITAELIWGEENYAQNTYKNLTQGQLPQKENEAACDTEVIRKLGIPAKIGSKFVLKYEINGEVAEKEMTLCGIWKGEKYEQKAQVLISEVFAEKRSPEKTYAVSGIFDSEEHLAEHLDQVLADAGMNPQKTAHDICQGYAYDQSNDSGTIIGALISVLLVLAAGYLIIYNIFRISVLKDIRLYGQLKTVGASPRQIKYMVRRQGMKLLVFGLPAGLVLGCLLGNLLLIFLMKSTNYSKPDFVVPDLFVWAAAAVFTFVTVWISCSKPGKLAGRVSPVEALRYQEKETGKKREKKGKESSHRIASMAFANLKRNKGKTLLVVLSISISIVLLNSVLNLTQCFDEETYVRRDAIADFNVSSSAWTKSVPNGEKIVPAKFAADIKKKDGVKDLGFIYYHPVDREKETAENKELIRITSINGDAVSENLDEFDPNRQLFGFDEKSLERVKIVEGEIDYKKMNSGDYVLMAGFLSDKSEYDKEAQEFHTGDVVSLNIKGTVKNYTVMAVVGVPTQLLTDYSSGGFESVILPAEKFLNLYPQTKENPLHCVFDAEKEYFDSLMKYIDRSSSDYGISVMTKQKAQQNFDDITSTYDASGAILALIFGSIGLLNLLNVIMTGAIARQNEFAVMRSIGMTRKQLRKLFIYEGLSYMVLVLIFSILTSGVMSLTVIKSITAGFWFSQYHFTVVPAFAVSVLFLFLAAVIAYTIDRIYNRGNIIDNLRKAE